jgi:hypothetical protein
LSFVLPLRPDLRKQWEAAGYLRGYGSSAVLPPPSAGFRRLYYLTGPDYAISNIVFGRLKVARFSELNDPFELLGTNIGTKGARNIVRAHKISFDQGYGVICFSEDWVDPVLWSHYASKHKGVALGFDVDDSTIRRVRYTAQRLKNIIIHGSDAIDEVIGDFLTSTKFDSWKYEREWRLLLELRKLETEGNLNFKVFGSNMRLREVILGPLCSLSLKRIRRLVDEHHKNVVTFKARLANRSFRIIAQGNTVL